MRFEQLSLHSDCERRRVLRTLGALTLPVLAGCVGDDTDDGPDSNDTDRAVVLGLDCGGEHLNEAPVIDGFEFYPTADVRENIDLEEANMSLPEAAHWWDDTLEVEPIPVVYNANPEEGAQSDSLPAIEDIQETEHDRLYQTAYWANEELNIEFSLDNGSYKVVLHLAETFFAAEQERVFDILINDEVVVEDLDIYAEVGAATALEIATEVDVTDNVLAVRGDASVNHPQISGIEIREANGDQTPVTIEESGADPEPNRPSIELIDADPDAGFHFPYFLYTPEMSGASTESDADPDDTRPLLVGFSPYAGPTSDREERLESGQNDIEHGRQRFIADEMGVPSLGALLPGSDDGGSFRNLDHNSLQVHDAPTARLDLQLLAMVEDARTRLEDEPYDVANKFHLDGFSSRGRLAGQFTMLHPERVNAISGGGNGTVRIPETELDEAMPTIDNPEMERLPWAVGVADLDELIGESFNREAWFDVNQFRYIGAEDQGDPDELDHPREYRHSPSYRHFGEERQQLLLEIFGWKQVDERFKTCRAVYEHIGAPAEFKVYEGVGHEVTGDIGVDIAEFHRAHMEAEFGR